MKSFASFLLFLFFCFSGIAQTQKEFYTKKLNTYFSKDHKIDNYVSIGDYGIAIISPDSVKVPGSRPEIVLNWRDVNKLVPVISTISETELKKLLIDKRDSFNYYFQKDTIRSKEQLHSLNGMKIAIDPGHIGGAYHMGETESRCMTLVIPQPLIRGEDSVKQIQMVEGNFSFFTALILKHKLDSMGAQVMLTRSDTGVSSLGITFFEWKKKIKHKDYVDSLEKNNLISDKGLNLLKKHLDDKQLFAQVFASVDMANRAKKINAFQPDLTVVIHYNVNEKNAGWNHTTDKDYVMTFVPGCVTSEDMNKLAGRLNFLRLLLSNDIENSVKLSSAVVKKLSTKLNVPIAQKDDATYLGQACLTTPEKGVYARDLALTRLIKGPLVYGEPLYQDNNTECFLLTAQDDTVNGFSVSKRIELVAEAYFEGIVEYIR